jgi:hypothetical protein
MAKSLKATIAELLGKKAADLDPPQGVSLLQSWQGYLAGQGYTVKQYSPRARVSERHIVLYVANDGVVRGALSDSSLADRVTPLGRMIITKDAKAADPQKA